MSALGISGVEPSGSATTELVSKNADGQIILWIQNIQGNRHVLKLQGLGSL
jgi:hypothetical protein